MKRIFLLVATNLAVMVVLSIVVSVLGLDRALAANGINYVSMLVIAAIFGFGGSFISLLMSKSIAKWSTGAHVIDGSEGSTEYWLVQTVKKLADAAGVGTPEVAVYDGPPNAFATGAFRNDALVAVSTGLMQSMNREEVEAVLGHELSHVANGDMVTLTLLQGVLNTFVFFLSRVAGMVFDRDGRGGAASFAVVIVTQLVFGLLASLIVAWFSRYREFRADAGSAGLLGSPRPMVAALQRLGGLENADLPGPVKSFGVGGSIGNLFATHPPIEARIAALQGRG